MEGQKWEDLEVDCLVNVLGRAGMESLLLNVPFVCKSWYKANLSPLCWEHLDFPRNFYFLYSFMEKYTIRNISSESFTKFVVDRRNGKCTVLNLSWDFMEETFK